MKPFNRIAMFIVILSLACISSTAQQKATNKPPEQKVRQVWISLKSGPTLTGDLVKMDPESVDFKVKGVLQSVKCDDLIGVTFIPPTPTPTPQTPISSQQQQTPTTPPAADKPRSAQVVEQPAQLPGRCLLDPRRPLTIPRANFFRATYSQLERDFRVHGSFKALGGKVSFYITDSENFANLVNRKKFLAFYSAVKVTEGTIDLPMQKGTYYLVYWNESTYEARVVEADLCVSYLDQ